MALKYVEEYNNTAIIGKREFKFKPWNTKNEKDYLIAVEAEENITDIMLYNILVKPCLQDQDVILSLNEQKMLMIEIRKKSLGSTFPMRYSCSSCGQVNDIDVSFDNIVNFKPDNFKECEVEGMIFTFGEIQSENLKSRLEETNSNVEYSFVEFLIHIKSIFVNGELEDSFTFEELKDFTESIPTSIFDEVYVEFGKMKSSLSFEYSTDCLVCGTKNDIDFENIPNFLWV